MEVLLNKQTVRWLENWLSCLLQWQWLMAWLLDLGWWQMEYPGANTVTNIVLWLYQWAVQWGRAHLRYIWGQY